jgi:hypothetical protein
MRFKLFSLNRRGGVMAPAAAVGALALLGMGGHTLSILADSSSRPAPVLVRQHPAPVEHAALPPEAHPRPGDIALGPFPPAFPPPGEVRPEFVGPAPEGHVMPVNPPPSGGGGGPAWSGAPLPALPPVGASGLLPPSAAPPMEPAAGAGAPQQAARPPVPAGNADLSSELPDERSMASARLANPSPQIREIPPQTAGRATPEQPVNLQVSGMRPGQATQPGENLAVKLSLSTDGYLALFRLDAAGQVTTVFQSPVPSRTFSAALSSGTEPGPAHLVALGSLSPLTGKEVAAALRSVTGMARSAGVTDAAWERLVGQGARLVGNERDPWQRHEWAVQVLQYTVAGIPQVGATTVTVERPAPAAAKPAPVTPTPSTVKPAPVAPQIPAPPPAAPTPPSVLPEAAKPEQPESPGEPKAPEEVSAEPFRTNGFGSLDDLAGDTEEEQILAADLPDEDEESGEDADEDSEVQ